MGGSDLTNWGSAPGGVPLRPYFGWKRMQNMMKFFILLKTCLRQSIRSIFTVVGPSNIFSIFSVVPPYIFHFCRIFWGSAPGGVPPDHILAEKRMQNMMKIFIPLKTCLRQSILSIFTGVWLPNIFLIFSVIPPLYFSFLQDFWIGVDWSRLE